MATANSPALLILGLPPSSFAGIDLLSFTTTRRFRGVKDLPPGFHFVFAGTSTAFSERHGLWFHVPSRASNPSNRGPPPLFIAKWNPATERLEPETSDAETLRQRANLSSIWREHLTPYRQTTAPLAAYTIAETAATSDWPALTSAISPALLSRITGRDSDSSSSNISNGSSERESLGTHAWRLSSASSAACDLEDIPGVAGAGTAGGGDGGGGSNDDDDDEELHFLPIDLRRTWRAGATGRERTEAARDRSWALMQLGAAAVGQGGGNDDNLNDNDNDVNDDDNNNVDNNDNEGQWAGGQAVLGELQFSFAMVLTLNNFSCLEQWKRVLGLVLTCRRAVAARPGFFVAVLAALRLQLLHCRDAEAGLIDLGDESGTLLKRLLTRFRKGLEGLQGLGVQDVVDELDDLEDYLREELGWQFGGDFLRSGRLVLEDGEQVTMETTAFDEDDETGEFAPQIVELTPEQARLLNVEHVQSSHVGLDKTSPFNDQPKTVVQGSDDDDDDDEDDEDNTNEQHDDEAEEDDQDLEEMDSRF